MIPDYVKNMFKRRTQGRISFVGPIPVTGVLHEALSDLQPGEVLELSIESGRQYAAISREDLDHVLELVGMRSRK